MGSGVVEVDLITLNVYQLLRDQTGRPIIDEQIDAEAENPDIPYAVANFLGISGVSGSPFVHPEEHGAVEYQFTSVGLRADQCRALSDRIRRVLTGRDATGAFLHAIPDALDPDTGQPTHRVLERFHQASPGAGESGGTLLSVIDRYALAIEAL